MNATQAAADRIYDVIVVGGGPSGATVATDLARAGHDVLLLDRAGRIKPCGGAIPPRLIRDFEIPDDLLVARVTAARMISPSDQRVDMPIDGGGYVGMVDRDVFDEWLRDRAERSGAERRDGTFEQITRGHGGPAVVHYRPRGATDDEPCEQVRARLVIGADGARSAVGRKEIPGAERVPCVFAYHEIVAWPQQALESVDPRRCDVYYDGRLSPDFYSWIFPHGETMSIGTGSAHKGFSLRGAVKDLRELTGLDGVTTIRREGAPIPLKPLKRWDNGRDVLLVGDAAGVVAPASGEGIYYAMLSGRLAGEAARKFLATGDAVHLAGARKAFMKAHGRVFWILGIMQYFWYSSDKRRERFVSMCKDKDVQKLTWDSYMNKELVRRDPLAHVKIFFKDMGHLLGLVPAVDPDARSRTGGPSLQ
ncbi:geranylgeranyl diphosphate reductase [Alsobacter sp. R-9]